MDQEFGNDVISIVDEDGVEYELEVLSTVNYNGADYYALAPLDEGEDAEEIEVSILKSVVEDGEPLLVAVEDEAELEAVYDLLMDAMYDEEDEEE
ncbi:MAG: DUF1292 domain-containing protein [Oscillospiraceae bacterium]|jgi:uncharacterized protein YrzB (UPF0473 family)|nr:DUF1292 domain-containing protein [Oscillospiraceae bacterium]